VAYRIRFTEQAAEHLAHLRAHERARLLDAVEAQLAHEPTVTTRNRKRLRANPVAPWVLRLGDLRVYYEVSLRPESLVTIGAIGVKVRGRVTIGGKEVDLS
jgi:mRNA-degrading endonuclease RelE of RelBE toxin-antitoxin system